MSSRGHELCEQFGYPLELGTILDEVASSAAAFFPDLAGIVLSPSISTGDFVWDRDVAGRVRFYSDVDGFVFARSTPAINAQFKQAIRRIESPYAEFGFKIDLSISPISKLNEIEPSYQMAETRIAGYELAGTGLLARFPAEFDARYSRQAFLRNLWKPLSSTTDSERSRFAARLMLDIPLLATSEAGTCRPGHRDRISWFLSSNAEPFGRSSTITDAVSIAFRIRNRPADLTNELDTHILPALSKAIELLDGGPTPPTRPNHDLVQRFTRWLPPRTVRRFAGELRTVLRRPYRPTIDAGWLWRRKDALGAAALWGMLEIAFGQECSNRATSRLLALFARREEVQLLEADEFLALARQQYRQAVKELYPSSDL